MNRKIQFISTTLGLEKVALEDKLERLINSSEPIGDNIDEFKALLIEIGQVNVAAGTWEQYVKEITQAGQPGPEGEPEAEAKEKEEKEK